MLNVGTAVVSARQKDAELPPGKPWLSLKGIYSLVLLSRPFCWHWNQHV